MNQKVENFVKKFNDGTKKAIDETKIICSNAAEKAPAMVESAKAGASKYKYALIGATVLVTAVWVGTKFGKKKSKKEEK